MIYHWPGGGVRMRRTGQREHVSMRLARLVAVRGLAAQGRVVVETRETRLGTAHTWTRQGVHRPQRSDLFTCGCQGADFILRSEA